MPTFLCASLVARWTLAGRPSQELPSDGKGDDSVLLVAARAAVDRPGPCRVYAPLSSTETDDGKDRGVAKVRKHQLGARGRIGCLPCPGRRSESRGASWSRSSTQHPSSRFSTLLSRSWWAQWGKCRRSSTSWCPTSSRLSTCSRSFWTSLSALRCGLRSWRSSSWMCQCLPSPRVPSRQPSSGRRSWHSPGIARDATGRTWFHVRGPRGAYWWLSGSRHVQWRPPAGITASAGRKTNTGHRWRLCDHARQVPAVFVEQWMVPRARPTLATTDFGQQLFQLWPRPALATFSPTLATVSFWYFEAEEGEGRRGMGANWGRGVGGGPKGGGRKGEVVQIGLAVAKVGLAVAKVGRGQSRSCPK